MTNNNIEETKITQTIAAMNEEELESMMFQSEQSQTEEVIKDDVLRIGETIHASGFDPKEMEEVVDTEQDQLEEMQEQKYPTANRSKHVSGNRKHISYGTENTETKLERRYRALQAAKLNRKVLDGVIVAARMVSFANTLEDILVTVLPTDPMLQGEEIYIQGEEISKILQWNKQEKDIPIMTAVRRRFAKGLVGAEIQFCIKDVTVTKDADRVEDMEYFVSGSRMMANEILKDQYFNTNNNYITIEEGDIVNGKILAVFANRIVYSIAGIDLYLYSTVPYITGTSRLIPGTSGKQLFEQNEDKDCLIDKIYRDEKTNEITGLRVSFYEPLKEKIKNKIDSMKVNSIYSGIVIRYIPSKDNGKTTYIVVKTDIGVEVLCLLPNWKRPPMEMDYVKVKIVNIRPNNQQNLVLGHIKR